MRRLFLIQVSNDRVVFEPSTTKIEDVLMKMMNDMIVSTRSFQTIDSKMMTLIRLHEGSMLPLLLPNETLTKYSLRQEIGKTKVQYNSSAVLQSAKDLVLSPSARELEMYMQNNREQVTATMKTLIVQPNVLASKFQNMEGVLDVNATVTANELATYLINSRKPVEEEEDENENTEVVNDETQSVAENNEDEKDEDNENEEGK